MRVEQDSLSRIAAQEDELADAIRKAAGFQNIKRAAETDVEERICVLLRRRQLNGDLRASHHFLTGCRLDNAPLDARNVISWNRALVDESAHLMPTVSEQLNCSPTDFPRATKQSDCCHDSVSLSGRSSGVNDSVRQTVYGIAS